MLSRAPLAALLLVTLARPAAALDVGRFGDVGAIGLPVAGLVVAAIHHDGKGALELAESYGATMAVVYGLKHTVHRRRPDGTTDDSFPSGHTASAFCAATFLAKRYGPAYGLAAYPAAAFVGWSRVYTNRHWPSDVLAGAAAGVGGAVVLTRERLEVRITVRWK